MTTGETYDVPAELSAYRSNFVSGDKLISIEKDLLKKIIN